MVFEEKIVAEMLELSQVKTGLHFNAKYCASRFLDVEDSFVQDITEKVQQKGPYTWRPI